MLLTAKAQAAAPNPAIVTPQTWSETPISDLLYGHFIELGYGVQVEPMRSEMLFNRSFEPFTPYKDINIHWFDLWNDPEAKDLSLGYKTDWRGEDWYHSGYEHNPWFAAPGVGGRLPIDEQATFLIPRSPTRKVEFSAQKGGSGHGVQHLRVINRETKQWGGLAQEGKVLRRGETYLFRGSFRTLGDAQKPLNAEVRLYREGNWDEPIARAPLTIIGAQWSEKTAIFPNVPYAGRATFALWLPPGGDVSVDDFSLLPQRNFYGWRPEVVDELKKIKPSVIRFPGGCFASFYDWRDGVGPHSKRPPHPSYFWGGQNYNDVGTDEFAMLCKSLNAEMMMCVNLFHPAKRDYLPGYKFPQFTDLKAGAKLAADWVAYCNLPAGTHPMADLRAKNGYPEPFGVKFWEIDNENFRWFSAEENARATVEYARAMKAVDPSIQIGLVTYGGEYWPKVPQMLEIAGHDVDFLANRGVQDFVLRAMNEYNARNGTHLRCANTEWLPYNSPPDDFNNIKDAPGVTKSFLFSKWAYAMNIFRDMMEWQRLGEDVLFVNFNNLANTHAQNVIETPKEGVYLSAAGKAFELLAHSPAAWPLKIEGYNPNPRDHVQAQVAWDKERKRLVLYVFNMTERPVEQSFDLSALGGNFRTAQTRVLWADSLTTMNTLRNPNAIRREERRETLGGNPTQWKVTTRPYSFCEVVLAS